jgi:hypothetical protein
VTPLFTKLNHKGQTKMAVVNAPASFVSETAKLKGIDVQTAIAKGADFVIAFAITQLDLDKASKKIAAMTEEDAVIWIAYPKGTSKKYKCEFNRDTGFETLGAAGFEPVRQVAIDDDWSALRFRRAGFIKSMTRSNKMAISAEGKKRTKANK